MKNKFLKFILSSALCGTMVFSGVALSACDGNGGGGSSTPGSTNAPGSSTGPNATDSYVVYFLRNCDDDTVSEPEVTVTEGEKVERPADPVRNGYEIEGWYLDEECTQPFDFDTPIMEETYLYANWVQAVVRHSVSFNLMGGEGTIDPIQVVDGESVEVPTDPQKDNCVFDGWYLDENYTTKYNFQSSVEGSFTLYAKWLNQYVVTFNYNYQGAQSTTQTVVEGTVLELPQDPSRDDFTFAGWYTDANCNNAYVAGAVTGTLNLYAKWVSAEAEKYDYTFNYNYTGAPQATVVEVVEGGIVQAPSVTNVTPEGKKFVGWYTNAACTTEADLSAPATGPQTFYAKWVDIFNVTYNYNYTGAPEAHVVELESGATITKPTDPMRPGYTFNGWATRANKEADYTFGTAISADVELFAQWAKTFVMEAEDVDYTNIEGFGFSGNAPGTACIIQDVNGGEAEASNGYYAYCLNNPGVTLEFNFTSDRAVENADFTMRLSAEIFNITIISSGESSAADHTGVFTVDVNGETLDYGSITLDNVPEQGTSAPVKKFQDYTFKIDLKEGNNTIKLIVDNNINLGGTMWAIAPMVDCIKVNTSATIVFIPVPFNY